MKIAEEPLYWKVSRVIRNDWLYKIFIRVAMIYGAMRDRNVPLLKGFIKPNSVVYDIGGYIGVYTYYMSKVRGAKVFTFEPNKINYGGLCRNIKALNINAQVFNVALDSVNRTAEFYISTANARSSLYPSFALLDRNRVKETVMVNCRTLDDMVSDESLPAPDVIKIDTEGNECRILEGGKGVIEKYHPSMLIEPHHNREELLKLLSGYGYNSRSVWGHRRKTMGLALWCWYDKENSNHG
jgi:FkbM family methyltransferase